MTKEQIIKEKLLASYPESWQMFEDSCKYSVAHNLDYITGILLFREKKVEYSDFASVQEQLRYYLKTMGYENIISSKDVYQTKRGHEEGFVFVIFLSAAAIKAYLNESERWHKAIKENMRGTEVPKRPIYEAIRYQNIYK